MLKAVISFLAISLMVTATQAADPFDGPRRGRSNHLMVERAITEKQCAEIPNGTGNANKVVRVCAISVFRLTQSYFSFQLRSGAVLVYRAEFLKGADIPMNVNESAQQYSLMRVGQAVRGVLEVAPSSEMGIVTIKQVMESELITSMTGVIGSLGSISTGRFQFAPQD